MNIAKQHSGFSQSLIALALLAAFSPAQAEESDDIAQLIKPESLVSVGVGAASGDSKDRARFGLYNGMRKDNAYGLFDIDYNSREDTTGTWTTVEGRNLGLDNRELHFSQQKQGDWKYSAEYSELTLRNPRTINTGLQGAGTTTPTVVLLAAPGVGADLDLKIKRESVTLGMEKWFSPSLLFEASFKNEDKDGARIFGRGFACTSNAAPAPTSTTQVGCAAGATQWAQLMLPEPINSTTKQLEAKLSFSSDKLNVTGGYYGSFYTNSNGTLTPTVPGILNNALGTPTALATPAGAGMTQLNGLQGIMQLPMALPPDNQAHQLYITGNYVFTPTTHATFKYAYTHATQNEDFGGMGLTGAPAGITSLDGVVDTTLAQFGLTAHPMPKLAVLANLRYEDKKDKTPIALYNIEGTSTFTNGENSNEKLASKLEGSYQLPGNYRATLGVDYESVDRGAFTATDNVAGLSGLRQKTDETGYRAELRRSMSETFNAAVSYVSSRRDGSMWLKPNSLPLTGVTATSDDAIYGTGRNAFPMTMENRIRDKVKLSADWTPTEQLSLQFVVEDGTDKYRAPTTTGLRDTGVRLYSIDAAYAISETWKLTGYWSQGDQMLHVNHSNGYQAALRNLNDSLGVGVVGNPSGKLEVGGDLTYINDRNRYAQSASPAAAAAFLAQPQNSLPDVTFRQTTLKFFGKYALEKNADVRIELVHQRSKLNEWTWGYNGVPFAYSDNTTISAQQDQNVTFISAAYIYKMK